MMCPPGGLDSEFFQNLTPETRDRLAAPLVIFN